MTERATFDLWGELPTGRLAIEASAGTGKTYTLSTLAARYIAEAGVAASDLLVVTFTRAAAAELKDRVRARLVQLDRGLEGEPVPDGSGVEHLATVEGAHQRIVTAITEFDAATITTIHGFAQQVLRSLGSAVDTDPDARLLDDGVALITQVATDLLARMAADGESDQNWPTIADLVRPVQVALSNPDAVLAPHPPAEDIPPGNVQAPADTPDDDAQKTETPLQAAHRRRRLIDAILSEIHERRRQAGSLSFEDLLVRLRDALADPRTGEAARSLLGSRYQVALIDEFQDTDPVQWAIFDLLFRGRPRGADGRLNSLVLVGDPKQAIYGFRGANVHTYLEATRAADPPTELTTLDRNYRSDGAVIAALNALFKGARFGDDRIEYDEVRPRDQLEETRLIDASDSDETRAWPALSIRTVDGFPGPGKLVRADAGRDAAFADLANHIHDLLSHARIPDPEADGGLRRVLADDIAVLVATGREAPQVRDQLRAVGIPAVLARGDSVTTSDAARQWRHLLHGLVRPAHAPTARAVALSWFGGWDGHRLAIDTDGVQLLEVQQRLHRWADLLARQGLSAFLGTLREESGVAQRVLAQPDGDRSMTDLDHLAELLQLTAPAHVTPATLLATFEALGTAAAADPEADLTARRVESEASAVQIMTMHVAKGLEFPIVCCPSLSNQMAVRPDSLALTYRADSAATRTIDVATRLAWEDGDDKPRHRKARAKADLVGSNTRLAYVALTRAKHHVAVWWIPISGARPTALARLLFTDRDDEGRLSPDFGGRKDPDPPELGQSKSEIEANLGLIDGGGDLIEVVTVGPPDDEPPRWSPATAADAATLEVAHVGRDFDRAPTRWSFSRIKGRAVARRRGQERVDPLLDPLDESDGEAGDADEQLVGDLGPRDGGPPSPIDPGATSLPLGAISGGTGFGTLVHSVLEHTDFTADDLEAELAGRVADQLSWNPWNVDVDVLVDGLAAALRTPLGPTFAGRALAELRPTDRLNELSFDLTLGSAGRRATDADVGALLAGELGDGNPLQSWAESVAGGPFRTTLAGHLTGEIDLVARVRHDDGDHFVVVDYKTNRLAPPGGGEPTIDSFHPDRLTEAMAEADYPLQAILYSVALHRYLRWRLPDYDPTRHLGGIAYLFVRGMVGPETPTVDGEPYGVFSWHPPATLVTGLSDLLDGAVPRRRVS